MQLRSCPDCRAADSECLIPARWLKDGGVPNWVLLLGA